MGYIESDEGNYHVMNDYGPLELKDQFHSLLDELSQYGNMHVDEENDGTFTVEFAGQTVVSGKKYAQMAITEETPNPTELAYEITTTLRNKDEWYDLNVQFATGGNEQLLVRNGHAGATVDITGITLKVSISSTQVLSEAVLMFSTAEDFLQTVLSLMLIRALNIIVICSIPLSEQ